jgi:alkylation response protein AidB-like acyl-CoA dehydrogenase
MSTKTDWVSTVAQLGPELAEHTAAHDRDDSFVADGYARLREVGAFSAGVPAELGGGDASAAELCAMVRELAHHCSSTALAFSMHTHLVATQAWLWRSGNKAPETLLRRVASEKLILISTGGADWLGGSGKLEKVEGGWRLSGRKIFCSGVASGDVLMTTGVYDDPANGPTVFHLPVSLRAEGVKVLDTWRVVGMRGTGSNDVELEGVALPEALLAATTKRPAGKWHPAMHAVTLVALPVIYAAYLGVAEAAREIALGLARKKKDDPLTAIAVGEMETHLATAQIAHQSMVAMVASAPPGPATTVAMITRRAIIAEAAVRAVEKAMEVAGGASFYRAAGLERLFRDVQGARFHPMPQKQQLRLAGRAALGLDIDV